MRRQGRPGYERSLNASIQNRLVVDVKKHDWQLSKMSYVSHISSHLIVHSLFQRKISPKSAQGLVKLLNYCLELRNGFNQLDFLGISELSFVQKCIRKNICLANTF